VSELVWYAAYGSNLSRARFDLYLRGGRPEGANHDYPGCKDPSAPIDDRPGQIDHELVFGGASRTWGGGVAFVDPDSPRGAKARMYLITVEQFADVVAQENWLDPGSVAFMDLADEIDLGTRHMYGLILRVGELDGHPIATVTQHRGTGVASPSEAYLRHVALGLRDAHQLADEAIIDYLLSTKGIAGLLEREDVRRCVSSPGSLP
jgi:hypothetical protein